MARTNRLVGPNAAVRKYDLLTAIALAALHGGALTPTQGLRLVAFVTAYYDWTRDEAAVGQEALMRLWGVSKRTVIRDLAAFRALGVLRLLAPGRRGRVAVYRLGHDAIGVLSAGRWDGAGAAFSARMGATADPAGRQGAAAGPWTDPSDEADGAPGAWAMVKARLAHALPEAAMARWIAPLRAREEPGEVLRLSAPSRFHAAYVEREHGDRIAAAACAALGRPVRLAIAAG